MPAKRRDEKRRSRKISNRSSKFFPMAILVIIILAVIGIAVFYALPQVSNDFVPINVILVENGSLIVGNNCTALIATTSQERLQSIELGLENKVDVRPTTHDNFVAVLAAFNITLDRVEIYRFDSDIFYSDAYFTSKDGMLQLDMRPSDAIALAVRTKSPVYINKTILATMGKNIC
jgi:bifunctional DNase/RNase